jgi:hypothetical protein
MTAATTEDGRAIYAIRGGTRLADFITSNRFVDIIQGPLGSGKTVGLCLRVMRHAQEQKPSPVDALRKSRWAIVRNSFPDLKRTTIRTWLDLFPEHIYGRFNWGQALYHRIRFGDILLEVDFLALDKPEDIRKLRSGEYTGIAFNEIPFIEKPLFDEATSRRNMVRRDRRRQRAGRGPLARDDDRAGRSPAESYRRGAPAIRLADGLGLSSAAAGADRTA